ncbi:immunoglobulin-binding protein 1 isoform X2 [Syngnathus typhle]|uniref:immunoglobulin-binding protein 1 isoform X2 n=1 Tax=Syngnathus typhle TaxID=161592 RepID=UPI002A6B0A9A|nr:immunoglobulin-binding protein 1 isoform X2 [Syngnathus typhle]
MAECKRSGSEKHDSHSGGEAPKLSDLFDRGWKILDEVDNTNDPLASNSVQVRVKRAIGLFEETSRMASQLDLFSLNEELDEIATADLKYLLSPALLGALTMKLTGRDKRLEIVQTARAYFMDFLKRCKDYNISHFHLPESVNESPISDEAAKNAPSACTAQVFGAGYPSLPTMTVDDWYDQHKKHGVLPDQGVPRRGVAEDDTDAKEREEEEKEKQTENDDDESLMKARKWDEWKDDHRRGYGNRQNMG